ncbi:hypothetical protein EES45_02895 [Streptomyces sp. ADI97-07]|nr:hypothetical protein EES45_02895 [Streptomyces sp. ADI97-07]
MVVPEGRSVRFAVTFRNVSQPPVTGTAAEPRRVPVGEPVRTSRVPPLPPEETLAVSEVALPRMYGSKEIQSPLSMVPTVFPPFAAALSMTVTPAEPP